MTRTRVFEGKTDYIQILDENGNVDKALEPQLANEDLDVMYRLMITVRQFDRKAMNLQRQGRLFTYLPVEGQEASQVVSAYLLGKQDRTFTMYRSHGVFIARGFSLKQMFLMWMGTEQGGKIPDDLNDVPLEITIGSQLPQAVGSAMASKILKKDSVTAVYFGDGATSEGEFHEALNMAGVNRAPVVFICENNLYAISVPRRIQTASKTIAQKALAYGFEGVQIDGNDVLAVYATMKEAVEKARAGEGPTLIECLTYRFGPHSTSDDPSKYRSKEEEEAWVKNDPVLRMQRYMQARGIWNEAYEQQVLAEAKEMVDKAFEEAEAEVHVEPEDIFKYVYAEMPENLKQEMEYLKKVEEEKKELKK
ncbi:MAG: pyruvate dehydrogenase (acetyl-transferring) E1 component subunit alpha [Candidatus Burarchaeum sp.]|nr:pyruvate dehydrogenase (acetyl-transferring) E1 component subunit alpha [Candidatus Burarchaeum sp.]MDO8340076.1 pyruvate dehydrogenase (acetyl-transferring) E1 component subunit alpha [Candidatus Burarchaeum sp.]